jgi:hypothetical protein
MKREHNKVSRHNAQDVICCFVISGLKNNEMIMKEAMF